MAAFRYSKADTDERIERVLEVFSPLRERMREASGTLSGGQQQMLALAMALMHDPEILLIDELSLGLSPIVVQELLGVVERLKESGVTMVIVEQSLNVALVDRGSRDLPREGADPLRGPGAGARRARRPRAGGVPRHRARLMFGALHLLAAFEVESQVVFNGVVTGMTYGVLAVGLVLVYRSTRVINFAYGQMGVFGAALLALLVINYDVDFYVALLLVLVAGGVLGAVIELVVVRRLFKAPRVILFVATLGVTQLLLLGQFLLPKLDHYEPFPTPLTNNWEIGGIFVRGVHVMVIVVVPVLTIALALFLKHSKFGTAVRAAADNPDAARRRPSTSRRCRPSSGSSPACSPRSPRCSWHPCAARRRLPPLSSAHHSS